MMAYIAWFLLVLFGFGGLLTGNLVSSAKPFEIDNVWPSYGPNMGSTLVTITGRNFSSIQSLQIKIDQYPSRIIKGNNSHILMKTDFMCFYVDEHLNGSIIFYADGEKTDTGFYFQVLPSPEILDFQPKASILSGGIPVTVIGENLDSVVSPAMIIELESTGPDATSPVVYHEFNSSCIVENSKLMVCPSPKISLPGKFNATTITELQRKSDVEFYVDFWTDDVGEVCLQPEPTVPPTILPPPAGQPGRAGATGPAGQPGPGRPGGGIRPMGPPGPLGPKTRRIDRWKPVRPISPGVVTTTTARPPPRRPSRRKDKRRRRISLALDPVFRNFEGDQILEFKPHETELIEIKGSNVRSPATENNYKVLIGLEPCSNISLFDNRIQCAPPDEQPPILYVGVYKENLPRVMVHIGRNQYMIGYIRYVGQSNDFDGSQNMYYIIGIVIGIVVLLVVVGVTFLICKKRRQRKTQLARQKASPSNKRFLKPTEKDKTNQDIELPLTPAKPPTLPTKKPFLKLTEKDKTNQDIELPLTPPKPPTLPSNKRLVLPVLPNEKTQKTQHRVLPLTPPKPPKKPPRNAYF